MLLVLLDESEDEGGVCESILKSLPVESVLSRVQASCYPNLGSHRFFSSDGFLLSINTPFLNDVSIPDKNP